MVVGVLQYRDVPRAEPSRREVGLAAPAPSGPRPGAPRRLSPDYDFGCKRPTFSNDYYPSLSRDNVHLETAPSTTSTPPGS